MGRKYQVISADGHLETPPEDWVKFVPERWKERAPRLVKMPEGGEAWIVEGRPLLHNGANIIGSGPMKQWGGTYFRDDGSPAEGAGPADQRLREQDEDGIDAEVLFPPFFASSFIEGISERAAYLAMVAAYNTFLAEGYCSVAPDRLIGSAIIPVSGIDDACAELNHIKELGIPAASPHQFPNGSGFAQPEDDRFWAKALELDIRLAPHISMGEPNPQAPNSGSKGPTTFASTLARRVSQKPVFCLAQLITSGVFDRFPEIRFFFAETNASWLPAALYFMDDSYELWKDWFASKLHRKPSEYILSHCYFSIVRDPLAVSMREFVPIDRIMWGSDFPHSAGSFPHSRRFFEEAFEGVDDEVRRQILLENPASYLGLDLDAEITETPTG